MANKQNALNLSCKEILFLLLSMGLPATYILTLYHSPNSTIGSLLFDNDGGGILALVGGLALPFVTAAYISDNKNPNKHPISSLVESLEKTQILLSKLKHFDEFNTIDLASPIHQFLKKTSLLIEHLNFKIIKEKKFQHKLQEYGLFTPSQSSSDTDKTIATPKFNN